jgi:hypothetical protein
LITWTTHLYKAKIYSSATVKPLIKNINGYFRLKYYKKVLGYLPRYIFGRLLRFIKMQAARQAPREARPPKRYSGTAVYVPTVIVFSSSPLPDFIVLFGWILVESWV